MNDSPPPPPPVDLDDPLVTVVLPTHNRPEYLRLALQSVLAQTHGRLQVIVADDAGERSAEPILRELAPGYHRLDLADPTTAEMGDYHQMNVGTRVEYVRHPRNLGVAGNITAVLPLIRGEFVAFLNDDDQWHPAFIQRLLEPLLNDASISMSFCDVQVLTPGGEVDAEKTRHWSARTGRDALQPGRYQPLMELALVQRVVFAASAAVVRTAVVRGQDLRPSGIAWDYMVEYLACRDGGAGYYSNQRLAMYGESEVSLMRTPGPLAKARKAVDLQQLGEIFLDDPRLAHLRPHFRRRLAEDLISEAIARLALDDAPAARHRLRRAHGVARPTRRSLAASLLARLPKRVRTALLPR